jgi:hypothetical protein
LNSFEDSLSIKLLLSYAVEDVTVCVYIFFSLILRGSFSQWYSQMLFSQ